MAANIGICSFIMLVFLLVTSVSGEDPYRFYTWNVTYGDIYPLGVKQQVLFFLIFMYLCCFFFWSLAGVYTYFSLN